MSTVEPAASAAPPDDPRTLGALRSGDQQAFAELVRRHHSAMIRVAMIYVHNRAVAEEVCQEAWIGVIRGLDGFQGRSSLRTWMFRILANCAKRRAEREGRTVPFSALEGDDPGGPVVDPGCFNDDTHPRWPNRWALEHWTSYRSWDDLPVERLLAGETRELIDRAVAELPPNQRAVITLRDIEGWESAEVCTMLGVSETNQRVLLHRARERVRRVMKDHLDVSET